MKLSDLISQIQSLDIKLWVENDCLRYDAPSGALTDKLRTEIIKQKHEIIEFLRSARCATHSGLKPIETVSRDQAIPLSFAQQRLWFLHQLMPNSYHYNLLRALSLKGLLNIIALEQSLNQILKRHESLRTYFEKIDGQPVQRIHSKLEIKLTIEDLYELGSRGCEQRAMELAKNEYLLPFDLNKGPLIRARLLRLDDDYHWFLLAIHHIISDAWSLGVLIHELSFLYESYSQGCQSLLPELKIQYADYSIWQRQWLSGEVYEQQLDYWKQKLAGHSILQLPTDRPRPAVQTFNGGHEPLECSQDLTASLNALSRKEGVTLFMTLLSVFYVLLHRYSGQEDILVGSPIANRNREDIEGLIGFFVNTLSLRVNLSDKPSFRDLLSRVREMVLEAYEHQDLPFEKLVEELQPQRDLSRNPLFQVMFTLQNASTDTFRLPGLSVSTIEVENVTAKFDLLLHMEECADRLIGTMEYNKGLYDVETIQRMIGHFNNLLQWIVKYPDQPISQLKLISDEERKIILNDWNRTERDYASENIVHRMFEQQAERTPESIAVIFNNRHLTYRQLNEAANDLAEQLRELGVCPDIPVGIMMERSLDMALAVLGVLKAGGTYVPMDHTYPTDRLSFILADTQARVLLTQQNFSDLLPSYKHQVLYLDGRASQSTKNGKSNPKNYTLPGEAAYLIYTSGSTGKPKGIVMGHGALCNLINWQIENTTIGPQARTLQFASLGFDVSFQEMFSTWCTGGTLVLIPESLRRDIMALLRFIDQMSVERIFVPFVVLQNLAEMAVSHNLTPHHLHEIITAGEQLQISPSIRKFISKLGHCTLHNQYGPSEAHVVTSYTLVGEPENWPKLPPIGRPIANVQIYILDKNMNPLPIGVPGELYIGGQSLARGYLNRTELTEKRFIDNPFSHVSGTRLYRTGDLARYLPDGNIEFLGRQDNQVKLRGFRIELGEIESVLRNHESVEEAVVLLREDESGDKRLAGYIVPRANETFSLENLQAYLRKKLPEYMIPSFFVRLESLPLTPNGKVDKQALPAPDPYSIDLSNQLVEPRTPIEQALIQIWSDVLRRNGIGIQDNFFHLGGHSLLATQVVSRVSETFGVSMPVVELFEHPTVSEFASKIESKIRQENQGQVQQIKPVERKAEMPLSFAQQRLWFISQLDPDSPLYNISMAMELKGQLNQEALQKGFNELFTRHESLRTRFDLRNGQPVQLTDPPGQVDIPIMDLSEVADPDREREAHRLVREEPRQPFDLTQGPLLRAKLIRITETDHILLLTMHHIVSDGWSLGVLFHELAALYESYTKGLPSPLPDLPLQYVDFAVWQRNWLSGQVMDSQMSYWRQHLSGELPVLNLPTDYPRPAIQTFNGASQSIQLSRELSESLKALSHHEHVTLFMTLLSAFKVLLHRYTGQEDIIVGSPVANRNRAEIEGLIGFFVNMLVLRSRVSGTQSFLDLLAQVRETTLEAYTHQDLPFEKLVDEFKTDRDLSRSPLFQVTFTLQNNSVKPKEIAGLQIKQIEMGFQTTRFDLEVHVWDQDGRLRVFFIYNRDLFAPSTIERLMNQYQVLLEGIISNPECRISRLPLMNEQERREILEVWNQTQTGYPRQSSIPELFELQVKRDPDAVAVIFKDRQLTYGQLNKRANQLAHYLRSLGVKRGSLVAVYIERSLEMVVSMLGILKAGGAYVPLDVNYPAQRLSFMLRDTESNILLTREGLLDRFSGEGLKTVCLDRDMDLINTQPGSDLKPGLCGDDLSHVMYTSGSTGTPKGVEILHRGVVRLVCNTDYIKLGPKDCVAHASNCSFDASTFEVWGALLSGARLVVLDQETLLSPEVFAGCLEAEGINVVLLTTALFNLLAKESPHILAGIENLFFGGEAANPQLVRRITNVRKNGRLLNLYGPTENTSFTTWYEVSSMQKEAMTVPIGKPIANTKVYVLDNQMEPMPVGVPGELYIAGDGLAQGYLNRPELTAERFIDDPFSKEPGLRLYRTGDLVRWLPEGILEFLGRQDHQVKLRGFRIELGEIESMLSAHESVKEAVVLLREDEPGDKRLVAYLVPRSNVTLSFDHLRDYLRKGLPGYMLPSYFVQLESLPLTPNGKLDRRALPVPGWQRQLKETYVQPKTKLERSIANIWKDVLHIDKVGIHDNFFDLGGNSLLMVLLRSKLTEIIKIDIPMIDLFRYPTISTLVAYLREEGNALSDMIDEGKMLKAINKGKRHLRIQLRKSKKLTSKRS